MTGALLQLFNTLKPHANGRNIVSQQLPNIVLHVASVCTPCCMLFMLLPVVGSCCAKFVTGQTFSYMQTDATTPNIVRPAMLGVNATVFTNRDVGSCCSVCTYYKSSVKPSKPICGVGEGAYLRGRAYLIYKRRWYQFSIKN